MDDEYLSQKYFVNYFGNRVKLGHIGIERSYQKCKYSILYTSLHIYLYDSYIDTTSIVKDWFREFYIMNIYV